MFTRRRTESARSTGSMTPADELSSWLGDDVCTTCGASVHAGQLYCSQQCRQEDAQASTAVAAAAAAAAVSNSAAESDDVALASTSAPARSHRHVKSAHVSSGDAITKQGQARRSSSRSPRNEDAFNHEGKFRYPCPPSPNILAKYGTHLTSPALAALDRRPAQTGPTSERDWMSSSEESTAPARDSITKRRSSSRSTFSSASETAFSTDPSTPSPAFRSTVDDLDDLEPTDLNLPPSVQPAATVLLNANARDAAMAKSANRHSPSLKKTVLPSKPKRETMMSFARRPSRTNLPAPVLFTSPVLATTMMKASVHGGTPPRRSVSEQDSEPSSTPSGSIRGGRRNDFSRQTPPALKRSSVSAMPVAGRRTDAQLLRKSPASPPQVASASSSAGKTLRAVSPPSTTSHSPEPGLVCGRFGCQGLSSSMESTQHEVSSSDAIHRPTMLLGHKHTHSAGAGLSLASHNKPAPTPAAAAAKLKMTPMLGATALPEEVGQAQELDRTIKSPPRGRSKARGRSSTSRRSPSPPRGAARRGRSEDMLSSKEQSRISPRSQPVSMSRPSPHVNDALHDADDERDEHRRGRSPTERGRPAASPLRFPSIGQESIQGANTKAKDAPRPIDTPGSISEVSATDSSGYDEVDLDEL